MLKIGIEFWSLNERHKTWVQFPNATFQSWASAHLLVLYVIFRHWRSRILWNVKCRPESSAPIVASKVIWAADIVLLLLCWQSRSVLYRFLNVLLLCDHFEFPSNCTSKIDTQRINVKRSWQLSYISSLRIGCRKLVGTIHKNISMWLTLGPFQLAEILRSRFEFRDQDPEARSYKNPENLNCWRG